MISIHDFETRLMCVYVSSGVLWKLRLSYETSCAVVPVPTPDKGGGITTAKECGYKNICHFMKFSAKQSNKATASPGSDAHRTDPIDLSNKPGPQRSGLLRIASWNMGTSPERVWKQPRL